MSRHTEPLGGSPDNVTRPAAARPTPRPAAEVEVNPVVGFLVFYSEMGDAKSSFPDPRLGRLYPMTESDIFFVGKAPLPEEVPVEDKVSAAPTGHHLFPATADYSHISRRHAVIRIGKDGTVRVTDLSTNGLFFVATMRHARRASGAPPEVHTFTGPGSIVFGLDDSSFKDPNFREKTDRFQVEIIPVPTEPSR